MLPRLCWVALCWVALCWGARGGGDLCHFTLMILSVGNSLNVLVCAHIACSTIAIFIHFKGIVFYRDLIPQGQGTSEHHGNLTLRAYVCALAFSFTGDTA